MKNTSSALKGFSRVAAKARRAFAALFAVPLLVVSVQVLAADSALRFHGQVTNAGCEVTRASGRPDSTSRDVRVSAQMTIRVDTAHNACAGQAIPFSARYDALSSRDLPQGAVRAERAGLLTLTYQ